MSRKGIMALEGLEELAGTEVRTEGEGAEPTVEDVTAFTEAPEGDLMEAGEAAAEIESTDAEIGEAVDTAETLETMGESVAEAVEEGGLSEPAAEAIRVAVEHMRTRLGFNPSVKFFPAMEGFKDPASRINASKIALESIQETAKKIWIAIVAAYEKAIAWLKAFYKHITDASVRMKSRAEGMLKAARGSEGKAGAGKVSGGFQKVLQSGGKVAEGGTFVTDYQAFTKTGKELGVAQLELTTKGEAALANLIDAAATDKDFAQASESVAASFANSGKGEASSNKDLGGDGAKVLETRLQFGDKSFYAVVPGEGKDAAAAAKLKFSVAPSAGSKPHESIPEVAALSAKEVMAVCEDAITHMAAFSDFREFLSGVDKAQASVKKAASAKEGANAANIKAAAAVARAYISAVTSGAQQLRSYDITVTKAALDFCGASLKGGKVEKPAEEKKAA